MTNLHQLIYALSDALDLVGVDDVNHGKRVAYMALECARVLQLRRTDEEKLFHAALLHDCGVSSSRIHDKLVYTLDWEGAEDHCIRGYQLLSISPVLRHLNTLILYHHTHYETLLSLGIHTEIAMLSNLIFLVDRVDALCAQKRLEHPTLSILTLSHEIRHEVASLSGTFFNPKLVEAFLSCSTREAFWFNLAPDELHRSLQHYMYSLEHQSVDLVELRQIAEIFALFVDAKSPYTADHSLDVAALSRFIAQKMNLPPDVCTKIEIAGLLHDLGKLRIPDELLNKAEPLSDEEFDTVKIHAFETGQILSQIQGLEEIAEWAAQHHEKLNGTGYPSKNGAKELSLPARIIAVADIFQALAQKRPYRKNLSPLKILELLKEHEKSGGIDAEVLSTVQEHLQACWEISIRHSSKLGS